MNVKALVLTGATIGVAIVTLVALNLIAPITQASESHAAGITADQVFAASIAEPGEGAAAEPLEVAALDDTSSAPAASEPEAAAEPVLSSTPAVAGGSCAMGASGGGQVVAASTTPSPSAEPVAETAVEMEVAQAEPEPAMESAPVESMSDSFADPSTAEPAMSGDGGEPAVAAGSCSTGMVDPSQPPVVVMAGGLPGDAPPSSGEVSEATAMEAEPAPMADAPAPEVYSPPAAPAPAPEPEPAMAAPAAEPAAAAPAKPKPKAQKVPKVQPAETKLVWWPAKTAGKLNLTYAGNASFTKAIVLIFDGAFDDGSKANEHIKVTTKAGAAVEGQWLVAKGNPQMLLYSVPPGIYKVSVGSGLTDKGNRPVAAESSGLVFVP